MWGLDRRPPAPAPPAAGPGDPNPPPGLIARVSEPSGVLAAQPSCYRSQREAGESLGNPEGAIDSGSHLLSLHRRNQGPQMAKDLGHKAQCSPPQNSYVLGPERAPPQQGSSPVTCTLRLSIGHSELRSPWDLQSRPESQHYPPPNLPASGCSLVNAPAWLDSCRTGIFLPSSGPAGLKSTQN